MIPVSEGMSRTHRQASDDRVVEVDATGANDKVLWKDCPTRNVVKRRPRKTQVSKQTSTVRYRVTVLRPEILVDPDRAGRGESGH